MSEVAVIGVPHEKWGEIGRAFFVPRSPGSVDAASLAAHVKDSLARYKQPKEYVMLDELPKSAANKVLKRLLSTEPLTAPLPSPL